MTSLQHALESASTWLEHPTGSELDDPAGHLPEKYQRAILQALGKWPRMFDIDEDTRRYRPDLVSIVEQRGGRLAVHKDAVLVDPVESISKRLSKMTEVGAPPALLKSLNDELVAAQAEPPATLDWADVVHLPSARANWPALERRAELAALCIQTVVPIWNACHPNDDRVARLASMVEPSLCWTCEGLDLRDELEALVYDGVHAEHAVRAVVVAHDRLTQNPARSEQTELEHLCAFAWQSASPELCSGLNAPGERVVAWYRWWVHVAVPSLGMNDASA